MDDIKFKALRKDGKGWEESHNLLRDKYSAFFGVVPFFNLENELCLDHYFEVIPETISRYTGHKDMNGVEIYEGDIVEVTTEFMGHFNTVSKEIIWGSKGGWHPNGTTCDNLSEFLHDTHGKNRSKIVGNIHIK